MACRRTPRVAMALAAVLLVATTVRAHDVAVDLEDWGNDYSRQTASCQRSIARAASLCAGRVLAARGVCANKQLRGEPCDEEAVEDRVEAARTRALSLVENACTSIDLQMLRYIDLGDALDDVVDICRELDVSAVTASYGPAMFGGTIAAVEGSTQACLDATGRGASRLLRVAMRARRRALDAIASSGTPMTLEQKNGFLARSVLSIARATDLVEQRILAECSAEEFAAVYGRPLDEVLARVAARADCLAESVYVQNAVTCPPAVCGDGMQASPETCDDGNAYEGDGCRDCVNTNCEVFPTTYDLIQRAIFENHGCTADACHGAAISGGLDLRAPNSHANLFNVASQSVPGHTRLTPGDKDESLLYINLADRTLPDLFTAPLRGMPIGLDPISSDELTALRIWIEIGAADRNVNIPEAAALLKACVPEPRPVEIDPLPPPPPGQGVQLHMPAYTLAGNSEAEVCFAAYYDLRDQIPAEFLSADGKSFRYKTIDIRQDPLSHHLIVDIYRGPEAANDPVWGVYKCRGGAMDGAVCDPLDVPFCGDGICATDPAEAIACIDFGPPMGFGTLTTGGLGFAQETTAHYRYPDGVYDEIPTTGVILWNSHAFNLTRFDGTLEAWVNITFPEPDQQRFKQEQLFNVSRIFWTDLSMIFAPPALPAFEEMDICHIHEFTPVGGFGNSLLRPDETAHLFELSGHTHQHGTKFQIFRGRFVCNGGVDSGEACSPLVEGMCGEGSCLEDGGRTAEDALLYTNLVYNDPIVLRFPEPILISGSAPLADRTLTYCAHYDNGATDYQRVKRRSTSPPGGIVLDVVRIGGPCPVSQTRCIDGPRHNELCNGSNEFCESDGNGGPGDCDACPLTGGFRTQDEMFVLFGNYWVTQ